MRWPWVPRTDLDDLTMAHVVEVGRAERIFAEALTRLTADVDRERTEKAYWVERYMDAVARSIPPESVPVTPQIAPPKVKSVIAEAIREESAGDTRLAGWYWKRVRTLKAEGKAEADIVAEIRSWVTTEDEPQPVSA